MISFFYFSYQVMFLPFLIKNHYPAFHLIDQDKNKETTLFSLFFVFLDLPALILFITKNIVFLLCSKISFETIAFMVYSSEVSYN
jgi:hypothetical protein